MMPDPHISHRENDETNGRQAANMGGNLSMLSRPGDYLPPDAEEIPGFKQRLNERLAPIGSQFSGEGVNEGEWEIGDTLAQWWRPNFETFMYPFLPAHVTRPKECKKLYFVKLPKSSTFRFLLFPFSLFSLGRRGTRSLRCLCELYSISTAERKHGFGQGLREFWAEA